MPDPSSSSSLQPGRTMVASARQTRSGRFAGLRDESIVRLRVCEGPKVALRSRALRAGRRSAGAGASRLWELIAPRIVQWPVPATPPFVTSAFLRISVHRTVTARQWSTTMPPLCRWLQSRGRRRAIRAGSGDRSASIVIVLPPFRRTRSGCEVGAEGRGVVVECVVLSRLEDGRVRVAHVEDEVSDLEQDRPLARQLDADEMA